MRIVLLSILFLLPFVSPNVYADEQEIKLLLARPFVKAEFEKVRKLKILSKPFVTTGKILFSTEKGLVWQTLKPIEDTLLIAHNGVSQLKKDNPEPVKINNPVVKSASTVFITILSLDLEKIKKIFDISGLPSADKVKKYILVPKDETLKKVIKHIEMSGRDRVEKIYIEELSGDSTLVFLSNEQFDKAKLSSPEVQLLEMM